MREDARDNLEVIIGHNAKASAKKYTNKKYNFTFEFPLEYIYDEIEGKNGLWHSMGYEMSKYPTANQMVIPGIEIKTEELKGQTFEQYLDERVIKDLDTYEEKKLGNNEIVSFSISEYMDETFYYIHHDDFVVSFKTYWCYNEETKTRECEEMPKLLTSLKFGE